MLCAWRRKPEYPAPGSKQTWQSHDGIAQLFTLVLEIVVVFVTAVVVVFCFCGCCHRSRRCWRLSSCFFFLLLLVVASVVVFVVVVVAVAVAGGASDVDGGCGDGGGVCLFRFCFFCSAPFRIRCD